MEGETRVAHLQIVLWTPEPEWQEGHSPDLFGEHNPVMPILKRPGLHSPKAVFETQHLLKKSTEQVLRELHPLPYPQVAHDVQEAGSCSGCSLSFVYANFTLISIVVTSPEPPERGPSCGRCSTEPQFFREK